MEKNKKDKLIMGLFILGACILGYVLVYFTFQARLPSGGGGEAEYFCIEKCGDYDYYYSVNDSNKKYIMCECVENVQITASPYSGAGERLDTFKLYFDSKTLEEISDDF